VPHRGAAGPSPVRCTALVRAPIRCAAPIWCASGALVWCAAACVHHRGAPGLDGLGWRVPPRKYLERWPPVYTRGKSRVSPPLESGTALLGSSPKDAAGGTKNSTSDATS